MKKITYTHYKETYRTWRSMKNRVLNVNHNRYANYGGRGIGICDRWLDSFENFMTDMGERPQGKTLDRIDNNKGYSPSNCRWATKLEQANNTTLNKSLTYDCQTMTLAEWARHTGMKYTCLVDRIRAGWSAEKALTQPVRGYKS